MQEVRRKWIPNKKHYQNDRSQFNCQPKADNIWHVAVIQCIFISTFEPLISKKHMYQIHKYLALLAIAFLSMSCNTGTPQGSVEAKTLYQKVLDEGKLKVGYISYPPSFIVNSDGSFSGIFYEVAEKISENLGIEFEYSHEVTWDGMIQDIKDEKIDMVVTGIWPTSQRGKQADFLDPLFYSIVKAYTFAGNENFDDNIEAINSPEVKISTIDGEMTQIIAKSDFPEAKQVPITQISGVSQTLLEVQNKKADLTFVEPIVAKEFQQKNPGTIQEVKGIKTLRVFPNCMMIPKNQEDLKSTLNIAIQELVNNGYVDKVIDKYEKYPGSYARVPSKISQ